MKNETVKISINRCPNGHGVQALDIDGRRITSSKCCGSWETVNTWTVDVLDILEAVAKATGLLAQWESNDKLFIAVPDVNKAKERL